MMGVSDEYFQAGKRVLEYAEQNREHLDRRCDLCRWRGEYAGAGDYNCDNPLVVLASFNETDSYNRDLIRGINEQRDKSSIYGAVVCGPKGALFEPRQKGFWASLLTG